MDEQFQALLLKMQQKALLEHVQKTKDNTQPQPPHPNMLGQNAFGAMGLGLGLEQFPSPSSAFGSPSPNVLAGDTSSTQKDVTKVSSHEDRGKERIISLVSDSSDVTSTDDDDEINAGTWDDLGRKSNVQPNSSNDQKKRTNIKQFCKDLFKEDEETKENQSSQNDDDETSDKKNGKGKKRTKTKVSDYKPEVLDARLRSSKPSSSTSRGGRKPGSRNRTASKDQLKQELQKLQTQLNQDELSNYSETDPSKQADECENPQKKSKITPIELDAKLAKDMESCILRLDVTWNTVVGLGDVKRIVQEAVSRPLKRPDLYKGIRKPSKGILLFGPPGTGKTMIGKCAASDTNATFFYATPSTFGSKWFGESEKLVTTLFEVARKKQPSIIFIDEVDALLSARSSSEQESTRKVKTQLLIEMDGARNSEMEQLIVIGATNRPQDLDSAALRRFTRHIYVPLPDEQARITMFRTLLKDSKDVKAKLSEKDLKDLAEITMYSGADITNVCKEAALAPLREIEDIDEVHIEDIRPVTKLDVLKAFQQVKPSVNLDELDALEKWRASK